MCVYTYTYIHIWHTLTKRKREIGIKERGGGTQTDKHETGIHIERKRESVNRSIPTCLYSKLINKGTPERVKQRTNNETKPYRLERKHDNWTNGRKPDIVN